MTAPKVWRLTEFREGKYNVYPYEADYIELYRGTSKEIFFDKKWEALHEYTDRGTEHDNALRLGYLIGFDSNKNERSEEEVAKEYFVNTRLPNFDDFIDDEEEIKRIKEKAWKVYKGRAFTHDDVAEMPKGEFAHGVHCWLDESYVWESRYGKGLNLKIVAPTDESLWIVRGDNVAGKEHTVHNLREMKQFISKDTLRNRRFQALYRGDIPLEWIEGVNDNDIHSDRDWHDLQDYIEKLRKKRIFEMEDVVAEVKLHEDIEQELGFLNELSDQLRKLNYYIDKMEQNFESLINHAIELSDEEHSSGSTGTIFTSVKNHKWYIGNLIETLEDIRNLINGKNCKGPGYTQVRKNLIEDFKKEFSIIEKKHGTPTKGLEKFQFTDENIVQLTNPQTLPEYLESVSNKIEEIISNIKELAEEEEDRMRREESKDLKSEETFEAKADKELRSEIMKIPKLEDLSTNIDSMIRKLEKTKEKDGRSLDIENDYMDGFVKEKLNKKL